ncbi:MAG TPA: hydroxymethylbilane synthase [Acidimicrobiales bacterium]|nr:hydroxymethylbilane synthase [Acidimicrobiales bacterium]
MTARTLRIATRGSDLARWQASHVAGLLDHDVEFVIIETSGDRDQHAPIWEIGGKGVFVKEVQAAVLDGRADVAVHSAKDLPARTIEGLVLAAVPERGDPRDALVGSTLRDLPPGARVATGSVRRRVQLADNRPDLTFAGLRGNIPTRLTKAADHHAIVVAAVALERLGLTAQVAEVLSPTVMLPQVAQGALAVECRADDEMTRVALHGIEHADSRRAIDAERAFLDELGGDCDLPAGAHATVAEGVTLEGLLASLDGRVVLRHRATATEPEALGRAVARHLLDSGGALLLEDRPAGEDPRRGS